MVVLSAQQCYRTCPSVIRPNTVAPPKVSRGGEIEAEKLLSLKRTVIIAGVYSSTKNEPTNTNSVSGTTSTAYSHIAALLFLLGSD